MFNTFFTSESVSEGHPDKIADQISDSVLDEILKQDPMSRVACETYVKSGMILIGGEISTHAWVDLDQIARQLIQNIGYTAEMGFDANSCAVLSTISKQSADIAQGVDANENHEQGAGDQGVTFGFATNETDVYLPAPIAYAHRLTQAQASARKEKRLPWLWPDAKSQVTIRYEAGKPVGITAIVLSTQHSPEVAQNTLIEGVMEEIIKPTLPSEWLDRHTKYHINPTGRFVIGGPQGDCGLTGRKIIVDTYGGMARHGGGAMSGKDPSKIDRSGSYYTRYIAKNIVAAGLASRCEVQIAYAIGVASPVSISIETFGTNTIDEREIVKLIKKIFDPRPRAIIQQLNLLRPIYLPTATYGHFGRHGANFSWENIDKVEELS